MLNNNIYQPELLDVKEIGKNFHLFALCYSNVTHVFRQFGLVGEGQFYSDDIFIDMLEIDKSEVQKGFKKLEQQGFIITSKIHSDRRSIATVGFSQFYHHTQRLTEEDDCFDVIIRELNHVVLFSSWDVKKIKNSRWLPAYLDIHQFLLRENALSFCENE